MFNSHRDASATAADAETVTALAEFAIAFMRDANVDDAAILATFDAAPVTEADRTFEAVASPAAVRAEIRRLIGAARG